jgi:hypothetical protein
MNQASPWLARILRTEGETNSTSSSTGANSPHGIQSNPLVLKARHLKFPRAVRLIRSIYSIAMVHGIQPRVQPQRHLLRLYMPWRQDPVLALQDLYIS